MSLLLYIKNYSALCSLCIKKIDFSSELFGLIGKNVIVFTDSGGISGSGLNGILLEVLKDSIRLKQQKRNTIITIMLEHIVAVSYHYI
jgi:hypothetical protein